jgi:hypothetical protein
LANAACDGADAADANADHDDACERSSFRAIGIDPLAWPPVVLRCLAKGDVCGGTFRACRRLAAMTDAARAEADRCFARGCAEYRACFDAFWSARVAPAAPAWVLEAGPSTPQ